MPIAESAPTEPPVLRSTLHRQRLCQFSGRRTSVARRGVARQPGLVVLHWVCLKWEGLVSPTGFFKRGTDLLGFQIDVESWQHSSHTGNLNEPVASAAYDTARASMASASSIRRITFLKHEDILKTPSREFNLCQSNGADMVSPAPLYQRKVQGEML